MAFKQALEAYELLSSPTVNGEAVAGMLRQRGVADVSVEHVQGEKAATDFVSCLIPGADPKLPALGIVDASITPCDLNSSGKCAYEYAAMRSGRKVSTVSSVRAKLSTFWCGKP